MKFPNPLKILSSPFTEAVKAVGGVIDSLTTTEDEKQQVRAQVLSITQDFQLKMAQVDAEFARYQAQVIEAEVKSASWLARNWRPILMLTISAILFYNWIIVSLFSTQAVEIPADMWDLLKLGVSGYIVGRTAEKITPAIADAIKTKKEK